MFPVNFEIFLTSGEKVEILGKNPHCRKLGTPRPEIFGRLPRVWCPLWDGDEKNDENWPRDTVLLAQKVALPTKKNKHTRVILRPPAKPLGRSKSYSARSKEDATPFLKPVGHFFLRRLWEELFPKNLKIDQRIKAYRRRRIAHGVSKRRSRANGIFHHIAQTTPCTRLTRKVAYFLIWAR